MAAADFPESYRDPTYAALDSSTEQKLGLPVGLLSSVRDRGERSNHSATNNLGTSTVYQFIPATRKAILDKFGLDVTLSPENASEGAGLLLKDSLERNQGDPAAAVGEYIGGIDRKNWGPTTKAYVNRVMVGQTQAKMGALSSDFAQWMANNPATPAAAPAKAAAPTSGLDAGFKDWLANQNDGAIPGQAPGYDKAPPSDHPAVSDAPQSLLDKAIGVGEAGLQALTGATGGAIGMVGGTMKGLAGAIADGTYGTQAGANAVEQSAAQGASALTYAPRGAAGQEYGQALGEGMQALLPIAPMTAEMGALGRGAAPAAQMGADAVRAAPGAVADAARAIPGQVGAVFQKAETGAPNTAAAALGGAPTPGTMGSVGAAGVDIAAQRINNAESLPVPIKLTQGQASRDFGQQRFEGETAKNPEAGAPIRERFAEQHQQVAQNMDAFVDATGSTAPDLRTTGVLVDDALRKSMQADKNEIRVAYKRAETAGELEAPVSLDAVVRHLNDSAPEATTAPLLTTARNLAIKLGIASDVDGALVSHDVPLNIAEQFRKAINRATDNEPTNIRQASLIKGAVDQGTESAGGTLYAQARALRQRFAQNYENHAAVSDILSNKAGTTDRAVALEDVHKRLIMDGSLDDVRQVRRVLQRPSAGEAGQQAWRELQGQTLNQIREATFSNVARNMRGDPIPSAAKLDRAISSLDKDGKLDFIFGKRGAQQLRDLNDIAKDILTVAPGSVNTSNTASVLMAALDMGITAGSGGLPLPVMSGLRLIVNKVKDRNLAKRVTASLNARGEPAKPTTNPAPRVRRAVH